MGYKIGDKHKSQMEVAPKTDSYDTEYESLERLLEGNFYEGNERSYGINSSSRKYSEIEVQTSKIIATYDSKIQLIKAFFNVSLTNHNQFHII